LVRTTVDWFVVTLVMVTCASWTAAEEASAT
jgi:hypothetical protein